MSIMPTMDHLLASLRAAAEPTRLRLLALAARGAFCVMEFTEILGQSQPRLSRHLKLLCDCGLLDRVREGANVWFALPPGDDGALARELVARLPADDPVLEADRRQAARVLAERARIASESFRDKGADWDEMRALDLPAQAVEDALLALVPPDAAAACWISAPAPAGCSNCSPPGCGRRSVSTRRRPCWRWRAPAWPAPGFAHCAVRLADMYRLPLADRVLRHRRPADGAAPRRGPGRRGARSRPRAAPRRPLLVIDLAEHDRTDMTGKLAHRWPGFSDEAIDRMFAAAGLDMAPTR